MSQCAGSCVSSGARRAGCRLHCSDRKHRLLKTAREKGGSGQFLSPSTKTHSPVLSKATSKHAHKAGHECQPCVPPESCAPCPAPCPPWPAARPRSAAPSASRSSGADTPLSAGEQAQTQRRCSQRNPRVTALQRTKAQAAAARCRELWRPTARQSKM